LLKNGEDPIGAPDFTLPVSIIAQVIPQLDVNISAQSIPTLNINIASISQGVTVTTTVSNMPSTFPLPSDQLSQLQQITIADIAAGLVFNVNVSHIDAVLNINNWPSAYPLPSDQLSQLQQITIQNVAAGLFIPIDIKQVTAQLNINNFPSSYPLPDEQVSTLQQITIENVAAGLYIPINIIKADAVVNSNATISGVVAGVYVPITIHSVESGVIFNINISSISSGVTFNVNITGTPTVNIQTSGGANIVIDKLTQGAYTERQSILENNGDTPSMLANNKSDLRGKFFPRGCRGFINYIQIYCDNTDSASHTFTVMLSRAPGMGPIATYTLNVAGGSSAAWRTIPVKRFWDYDSLFIWVSCDSDSYGRLGYDGGTPYDYYYSSDGKTWTFYYSRWWFRVSFTGETVGDLPVSGTINTVVIPNVSSMYESDYVTIPGLSEATILTFSGAGECDTIYFGIGTATDSHKLKLRVYCDGSLAFEASPQSLFDRGFTASTPHISLLIYNANNVCTVLLTKRFTFRRELRIAAYATTSNSQLCVAWALPSLVM
jgi:hypothetical protein